MTALAPQWNPSEVLGIDSDLTGSRCIGHAKTQGRRCRNPIAGANCDRAAKLLQSMSRQNVQSVNLESLFASLAGCLLCRRWHQDQVAAKVRQWKSAIERFRTAENTQQVRLPASATPTRTAVAARATAPSLAQTLESLRQEIASLNERYATALQLALPADDASSRAPRAIRRINSISTSPLSPRSVLPRANVNDSQFSTIDLGASVPLEVVNIAPPPETTEGGGAGEEEGEEGGQEREDQEAQAEEEEEEGEEEENEEEEQDEEVGDDYESEGEEEHEQQEEEEEEEERNEQVDRNQSQSSSQGTVLSPPLSEPGISPDEGSSSNTTIRGFPRQPTEGECPICCEDFTNESILSWCRAQCGKNYHTDCVYRWLSSQEDSSRTASCPHCRTEWLD